MAASSMLWGLLKKQPNPRFTRHLDKITKSLVGEQRISLVLYSGQQDHVSIPAETTRSSPGFKGCQIQRPMTATSETSWVLVTNDDGGDSPALVPLMRELLTQTEVGALVPERECSWSSKTMSRFGELELTPCERDGVPVLHCQRLACRLCKPWNPHTQAGETRASCFRHQHRRQRRPCIPAQFRYHRGSNRRHAQRDSRGGAFSETAQQRLPGLEDQPQPRPPRRHLFQGGDRSSRNCRRSIGRGTAC